MPGACDADFTRVMEWVAVCAILHNICIRLGDISPHDAAADAPTNVGGESLAPLPPAASAARSRVQQHVLQCMIAKELYHG